MPDARSIRRAQIDRDMGLVAIAFLAGWLLSFNVATLLGHVPPAFVGWSDQDRYLQSARAFAHWDLRPDQHWYPLLYALILAPFSFLPPLYETAIPDFACYLLTYWGFRRFARGFGVGSWGAAALFIPATVAYPRTGDNWLQPWTTTPSAALIWVALALAADLIRNTNGADRRTAIACGLALGLIPVCRPGDLVIGGTIGLCLTAIMLRRSQAAQLAQIIVAALLPVIAGVMLHCAIYGVQPSDYMRLSATYGEKFDWLGWKSYLILIDPRPWYPTGTGLFALMPWLPLGLCGLAHAARTPGNRAVTAMTATAIAGYGAITIGYMDLLPSGLWQFGNVHYFKWIFPALALFAWVFVRDARHQPGLTVATIMVVLTLTSVRVMPVMAGPNDPARLVLFARPDASFKDIYDAHSVLQDRQGILRNSFDFHLVPGPDAADPVFAEALRRNFVGQERWINPGDIALWPKLQTTHYAAGYLPGHFPIAGGNRYSPQWAFGLPCWLPPYPCPSTIEQATR